jgi:hypothetical protein
MAGFCTELRLLGCKKKFTRRTTAMKSLFRTNPFYLRTFGALAFLRIRQFRVAEASRRRATHFKFCVILLQLLAVNLGGAVSALNAQERGWNRWVDPVENAFSMEVPEGWSVRGGAYRLGYGDIRVMVNLRSPDGKINIRYGDIWFAESYAVPDQYHREGEPQDLGALGQGIFAAYRTGQQFAEIYARASFRGVCRRLTPQRTDPPPDTSVHRQPGGLFSTGAVTFRCDTPQGERIAYATARTTLTTSQTLANAPATTGWTPELASFLAPADQVPVVVSIAPRFIGSFRINPRWRQHQQEMDREGTAYAISRAQGRITQIQSQFEAFTQRMNAEVSHFQAGESRNQDQVDNFSLALNGVVRTNDPTHPTVDQGTHSGKWNCGVGGIKDSDLAPGPGCVRIN